MNINDEHAELVGLAIREINDVINGLHDLGIVTEYSDLVDTLEEAIRYHAGNPITRVEAEQNERVMQFLSE